MRTPVVCPDLGAPGLVSHWHARPGESVVEGARLVEVLIPGALIDIPAPTDGVLVARHAEARDRVSAGDLLGELSPG